MKSGERGKKEGGGTDHLRLQDYSEKRNRSRLTRSGRRQRGSSRASRGGGKKRGSLPGKEKAYSLLTTVWKAEGEMGERGKKKGVFTQLRTIGSG